MGWFLELQCETPEAERPQHHGAPYPVACLDSVGAQHSGLARRASDLPRVARILAKDARKEGWRHTAKEGWRCPVCIEYRAALAQEKEKSDG